MEEPKLTGYPSIDKPWLKYYAHNADKAPVPELSIFQMLEQSNQGNLKRIALEYYGVKITYKEYLKRIRKIAVALKMLGVKENEIVVLLLPNIPECRMLIYGINILGAIAYPVSPAVSENELLNNLESNNVKSIFCFDAFYQKKFGNTIDACKTIENIVMLNGKESLPRILTLFSSLGVNQNSANRIITWDQFMKPVKSHASDIRPVYKPEHTAVVIGTSGTTGTPKGVCLTNENLNAMAVQHQAGSMNICAGDKLLDVLIQSIGYGVSVAHYSGVCGIHSILIPQLVTDILPLFQKYKPDHFTGGPIHYEGIAKHLRGGNVNLPYGKNFVSGGAALSKDLEKILNNINDDLSIDESKVFVRQGLGCTESGGVTTYSKQGAYKLGSVGIPLALETMGVFEPGTDRELPYYQMGEICVSGPTVMKGYLNNPAETANVLRPHSDGRCWLHTCDIGYVDEDGNFYICDRIKNIFMRKGFNVHPSKIEEYISTIDTVVSCKVVGVEHPEEQMVPIAFVQLAEDADVEVCKENILRSCYGHLEETSVPYEIVVVDSMPRNLGGKVDVQKLLNTYKNQG